MRQLGRAHASQVAVSSRLGLESWPPACVSSVRLGATEAFVVGFFQLALAAFLQASLGRRRWQTFG